MHELSGKAVIVTGASRGIGAAAAAEFARIGACVLLAARNASDVRHHASALRDAGAQAEAIACDVSNYDDVQAMVSQCESLFGRLDVLINNAGVIEPIGHLATSDPKDWAHAVDINFKGAYYAIRCVLPHMLNQRNGTIINVSSGAAHSALEGWSHYCSAKAALHMLTRCAAGESAARGVRVIGLSPGTVATDMQRLIKASGVNPVSQLDDDSHVDATMPARALVWLSTQQAAHYSGQEVSLRDEEMLKTMGLAAS